MIQIACVCKRWKAILDEHAGVIPPWRRLKLILQSHSKTEGEQETFDKLQKAPLHKVESLDCSFFSDRCASLLVKCTNLAQLKIDNSTLTDEGFKCLATKQRAPVLRTLIVQDFFVCNHDSLTDEGIKWIAAGFPYLQTLSVNATNVTDQGLKYLSHCHQLESLTLILASSITDSGLQTLFQTCKNLKELKITFGSQITDATLQQLPVTIRRLKLLVCKSISKTGITEMYQRLPNIEELTVTQTASGPATQLPAKIVVKKAAIHPCNLPNLWIAAT
jgi:hypothetical protein